MSPSTLDFVLFVLFVLGNVNDEHTGAMAKSPEGRKRSTYRKAKLKPASVVMS